MQANQKTVAELLSGASRYIIPVFQRYYCWAPPNWEQLWVDLLGLIQEPTKQHFLGALVTVAHDPEPGAPAPFHVIDGQQRLTTLSIIFCTIRDAAKDRGWEELAAEIDETYIVHRFKKGEERYRLFPRQTDRAEYFDMVRGKAPNGTKGLGGAYRFFRRKLSESSATESVATLRQLLDAAASRLVLVSITLSQENPYRIFKSLNSTGVDLEQGDLIRNHVFMAVPSSEQDEFDELHWKPLEAHFEENGRLNGVRFAGFLRDSLLMSGEYLGKSATYDEFDHRNRHGSFSPLASTQELRVLAGLYDVLEGRALHGSAEVNVALSAVRDLQVTTSWPVILRLLEAEAGGRIEATGLARGVRSIASFVLRRLVCGETSRGYGRWFCAVCKELGTDPVADLERFLESKGWPDDRRFVPAFVGMDLYNSKYRRAVLDAIEIAEQHKSERVELGSVSIEHVMPRTLGAGEDGDEWRQALGANWRDQHARWLDTPGNLTLVGADYNSSMQNSRFAIKKQVLGGRSVIALNRWFADKTLDAWDAEQIEFRGRALAEHALELWPAPAAPEQDRWIAASAELDHQSLAVDDIVRVLTRSKLTLGQRVFFKAVLEAEDVSTAELRDRLGPRVGLASLLSGLGRRINGTNLRSTGGRPGLVLVCDGWVEGGGTYRARPELVEAIARLPDLDAYLRGATWDELTADSAYIGYEAG